MASLALIFCPKMFVRKCFWVRVRFWRFFSSPPPQGKIRLKGTGSRGLGFGPPPYFYENNTGVL